MPLPQNFNVMLGAGVFGIVCAATLYVMEHYRQDRRRHAMAKDLARLNSELTVLRQELDGLLALQKQKGSKRGKKIRKLESIISSSTLTEDYTSAFDGDSSDLEFYDVSDEEGEGPKLDADLEKIDSQLDSDSLNELNACLEQLQNLCLEYPGNFQLLWRLGRAHYRLFEKTDQKDHLHKGIEACTAALKLKHDSYEVHKWMAILIGARSQIQPVKERILDGQLFKKHLDEAVKLNPEDATLYHMLGRFAYDIADLKWYERKVASALYAEVPEGTFEEALEHFEEADKLSKTEWKENLLYIAKSKIKLGREADAVEDLKRADAINVDNGKEDQVDSEVKELLKKYSQ